MSKRIKTFTQTSQEPYDKHSYKLYVKNALPIVLDDYEQLMAAWTMIPNTTHVEILDKCQNKN